MKAVLLSLAFGTASAQLRNCDGLEEKDCVIADGYCRWYSSVSKCYQVCSFYTDEATCSSSLCSWTASGNRCELPRTTQTSCADIPVRNCFGRCGLQLGTTNCVSCDSVTTVTACMAVSNCRWSGAECGAPLPCAGLLAASCNAKPECYWDSDFDYCTLPEVVPWCGIGNSLSTKCAEWRNSSPEQCSGLSIADCVWKADCNWHRSNECIAADRCRKCSFRTGCKNCPGCWKATPDACTAQALVCKDLTQDSCSRASACVWEGNACLLFAGCKTLRSREACESKECIATNVDFFVCKNKPSTTCSSLSFTCDGSACSGLTSSFDLSTYQVTEGSFKNGALISDSVDKIFISKGNQYCIDCEICKPGLIRNSRIAATCASATTGSFVGEICLEAGKYPDANNGNPTSPGTIPIPGTTLIPGTTPVPGTPSGAFQIPESDDSSSTTVLIVVVVISAVVFISIVAVAVYLLIKRKKKALAQNQKISFEPDVEHNS